MISDFVGSFYEDATRSFDYQRCINWYPKVSQSGNSKSKVHLVGSPGLRNILTASTNNGVVCRGLYETAGGRFFGVWGNTLIEISIDETQTDRNTTLRFNSVVGNVSMADNGTQLIILAGGDGFIYTLATDTIEQILDVLVGVVNSVFPTGANQVVFNDGFFLVSLPGTKAFYKSALQNGLSWDALDKAEIRSAPDNIIGLIESNTDVWMFGEKSIEVWENVGNADFPYIRREGATQNIGTKNPWTIQKINGEIYFLGSNKDGFGIVWRTNGYNLQQISTDVINEKLNPLGNTNDAISYTYQEKGHYFYVLTVPSLELTFAYDSTTNFWHERAFWNTNTALYERHKSTYQTFAFGKNYIGHNGSGILSHLDSGYYFDDTELIRRLRIGAHLHSENKLIRYNMFELEFERGQGLVTGQGSDPQVMFNYSDDGGFEWSNEQWVDMGEIGEYNTRARWHSQGTGRDRVLQIVITDPVKSDIIGMYMDIEVLKA